MTALIDWRCVKVILASNCNFRDVSVFPNHIFRCGRGNNAPLLVSGSQNLHQYAIKPTEQLFHAFRHSEARIFQRHFELELACILQNGWYLPLRWWEPNSFATCLILLLLQSNGPHIKCAMASLLPTKVVWNWLAFWIQTVPGWGRTQRKNTAQWRGNRTTMRRNRTCLFNNSTNSSINRTMTNTHNLQPI